MPGRIRSLDEPVARRRRYEEHVAPVGRRGAGSPPTVEPRLPLREPGVDVVRHARIVGTRGGSQNVAGDGIPPRARGPGRQRAAQARRADDRSRPARERPRRRRGARPGGEAPPPRALARQRPSGRPARAPGRGVLGGRALSARHPRRRDGGNDRLPHRAGARQPPAVRDAVRDDPDDGRGRSRRPGLRQPDEVHRPRLRRAGGPRARQAARLGVQAGRRSLAPRRPLPRADADLRAPADQVAAREGDDRHLRRRRRHPHDVRARTARGRSSAPR